MALPPLRLPRLQGRIPIVDSRGNPADYFLRFLNVDFAGAIERGVANISQLVADLAQAVLDIQAAQAAADAAQDTADTAVVLAVDAADDAADAALAVDNLDAELGPLAKSPLTPAEVQGRYFGQFAGDAAAIAAGLQDGDLYIDTDLYPAALKTQAGGVIREVDTSGISLEFQTQQDVPTSSFTALASLTVPTVSQGSIITAWWTAAVETTPNPTTVGAGTINCAGDYKLIETGGSADRTLMAGDWSATAPGGTDVTEIIIDGYGDAPVTPSPTSQRIVVPVQGARTYRLELKLDPGDVKPLLDVGIRLYVQIQRVPT